MSIYYVPSSASTHVPTATIWKYHYYPHEKNRIWRRKDISFRTQWLLNSRPVLKPQFFWPPMLLSLHWSELKEYDNKKQWYTTLQPSDGLQWQWMIISMCDSCSNIARKVVNGHKAFWEINASVPKAYFWPKNSISRNFLWGEKIRDVWKMYRKGCSLLIWNNKKQRCLCLLGIWESDQW